MERNEFYQKQYYFELDRKDKFISKLTFSSSLVTVLFGIVVYLLQLVKTAQPGVYGVILFVEILGLILSLGFAVYYLTRSHYKYTYQYLPKSVEIETYWKELVQYYNTYSTALGTAEETFNDFIIENYCTAIDTNTLCNNTRTTYFYKANTALIVTIICALFALAPLNYDRLVNLLSYVVRIS